MATLVSGCDTIYKKVKNGEDYPMNIGILWSDWDKLEYYDFHPYEEFGSMLPDRFVKMIVINDKSGKKRVFDEL